MLEAPNASPLGLGAALLIFSLFLAALAWGIPAYFEAVYGIDQAIKAAF